MLRLPQWLAVIGMAALAALTYWVLQNNLAKPAAGPPPPLTHTADYFADNFSISMLDNTGLTQYRLNAQKMVHYEDDQNTDVTLPSMRAFSPGEPNTTTYALRGVINADGSIVDLYDQARMLRDAGPEDPAMRADSSHFRIYVNDDVVQTEKPVKLQRGESVTIANGMIYNNTTRVMHLLGQVRGVLAASDTQSTTPSR